MIFYYCDVCKDETEHERIKGEKYRCKICGSVRQIKPKKEVEIKAILSTGGESEVGKIKVRENEILRVGEEIIVEMDELKIGEIKALELRDGRRVSNSEAKDVSTVWLRNVSEVYVKFSLHKGAVTTSYKIRMAGETELEVGERIRIGNHVYRITRIKKIDGRLLKEKGNTAKAKEIKRVYAMFEL